MKQLAEYSIHLFLIVCFLIGNQGYPGVTNLFSFFIWGVIIIGLLSMFVPESTRKDITKKHMDLNEYHSAFLKFVLVSILAYYGWFWTAGFYGFCGIVLYAQGDKLRKEIKSEAVSD